MINWGRKKLRSRIWNYIYGKSDYHTTPEVAEEMLNQYMRKHPEGMTIFMNNPEKIKYTARVAAEEKRKELIDGWDKLNK